MGAMLNVDNLTVRYGEATILDNLSFSLEEGEWLMICGPNGAGKSTTISAITQSVPYTGTVRFEGEDLRKKKKYGGCTVYRRAYAKTQRRIRFFRRRSRCARPLLPLLRPAVRQR